MEDNGENNEEVGSRGTLQTDPRFFQDTPRVFFQPAKHGDPRFDFYTIYKREATEYDRDLSTRHNEDFNIILVFAGLSSTISSAFIISINAKLEADPDEQSAALLRAILLTLNQSAIPAGSPLLPLKKVPPSIIITAAVLMYASLMLSLLAAFITLLGKQWLNRYIRKPGGSMIEGCGDRQRKCDGLRKFLFDDLIEGLSFMLQVAVFLLAFALMGYTRTMNTAIAYLIIIISLIGILFYSCATSYGVSSYQSPFQSPLSVVARKLLGTHKATASPAASGAASHEHSPRSSASFALRRLWEVVQCKIQCKILHVIHLLPPLQIWHRSPGPSLPITQPTPQHPPLPQTLPPQTLPPQTLPPQTLPPQIIPDAALVTLRETNANDIRCISWTLREIISPEALYAAIRLAGMVRWFEDENDVESPYDQIVSIFGACSDSTGKLYPRSRNRAYYSAQAVLWIHIRAMSYDSDLHSLLKMYDIVRSPALSAYEGILTELSTPAHTRWTSDALLHLCWAKTRDPDAFGPVFPRFDVVGVPWDTTPLDAALNLLLVWSICLGSPVSRAVLEIQDKTVYLEQVVSQFSFEIIDAIHGSSQRHSLVRNILVELSKWNDRPGCLRDAAYGWCSAICEEYSGLDSEDGKELLFLSLKICSRGLDARHHQRDAGLVDIENHQLVGDAVFNTEDTEAISDLLQVWTAYDLPLSLFKLLEMWPSYPGLQHTVSTSPRLRELVIHSVEHVDPLRVEEIGIETFTALLDCLSVGVDDMVSGKEWLPLLLHVVGSQENPSSSDQYWELMAELVSGDLKDVALSLFRQRPGAVEKLGQWMQRPLAHVDGTPERLENLQWIYDQGVPETTSQQGTQLETGESSHSSPSVLLPLVENGTY